MPRPGPAAGVPVEVLNRPAGTVTTTNTMLATTTLAGATTFVGSNNAMSSINVALPGSGGLPMTPAPFPTPWNVVVPQPEHATVLRSAPNDNRPCTRSSTKRLRDLERDLERERDRDREREREGDGEGEARPAKRIRRTRAKADDPPAPSAASKVSSVKEVERTLDVFAADFTEAMKRAKALRLANQGEAYKNAKSEMLAELNKSFSSAFEFFEQHKNKTSSEVKDLAIYLYGHKFQIWATMLRGKFIEALPFRRGAVERASFSGWFQANPNDYQPSYVSGHCIPAEGIKGMRLGNADELPTDEDFAPILIMASALKIKNDENLKQAKAVNFKSDANPYVFKEVFDKFNASCANFLSLQDAWRRKLTAAMDDELYGIKSSLDDLLRPAGQELPWPNAQSSLKVRPLHRNAIKVTGNKSEKRKTRATTATTTSATTSATPPAATSSVAEVTNVFPAVDPPFHVDDFLACFPATPGLTDSSFPTELPATPFENFTTDWSFLDQDNPGTDEVGEFDGASK